ncbi:MAG TPA: alkaline phosphatase family protein [Bacteroidia bacterium]|nr:alkaline phosphatase family protein [Bacteroidia bacterium]
MKKITQSLLFLYLIGSTCALQAQYVGKAPAHVVFVIEENYSYAKIIGSAYAPTLTWLSKQSYVANLSDMYAITHPSEPNYLELFSGSNQGVSTDEIGPDASAPFSDCNMASSMIQKGYTFKGYAETQPSVGWYMSNSGNYVTKHCPWINWVGGTNADSVPIKDMVPFAPVGTYFPDSNSYSTLPTLSWVVPNLVDDMHDPYTASTAISNGDAWFKKNIMSLVRWASNSANNTVVVVIWDEDDGSASNNIPCLICSGLVKGGTYSSPKTNLYSAYKLIEEMYSITPQCGSSATATDITSNMWNALYTGVNSVSEVTNMVTTWPVPAKDELNMNITSVTESKALIGMYDITGRLIKQMPAELKAGDNSFIISTNDISNGIYFLNITGDKINICKKILVGK